MCKEGMAAGTSGVGATSGLIEGGPSIRNAERLPPLSLVAASHAAALPAPEPPAASGPKLP